VRCCWSVRLAIGLSGSGVKVGFLGKWLVKISGRFSSSHWRAVSRLDLVVRTKILPSVLVGSIFTHQSLRSSTSLIVRW